MNPIDEVLAHNEAFVAEKRYEQFEIAIHIISASFAVGLNCPVSIELIVLRDTPTISASSLCEICFLARASFKLFFKTNSFSIIHLKEIP